MSYLVREEFIRAEFIIDEGKIEEALQLLNNLGKLKNLSSYELATFYRLKSLIAFIHLDRIECAKYAEKAVQESEKTENSLLLLDVYINMASSLLFSSKINEASEFIKKSESLYNSLSQDFSTDLRKRNAYILWNKAVFYHNQGDLEKAKQLREEALPILEEIDLKFAIANMTLQLGMVSCQSGDLNPALEYCKTAKTLFTELKWLYWIHYCNRQLGVVYHMKGELDLALSYAEKVLAFGEKENVLRFIIGSYNHIGMIYQEKGNYNRALVNLEKCMRIVEDLGTNSEIFAVADSLFHLTLDMNDLKQAQRYLNQMKQIADHENLRSVTQIYKINNAIYLKNSPRAFDRGKSEEMLKQLIKEGIQNYDFLTITLLNLCDLLLSELEVTDEPEILEELQSHFSYLLDTAENSRSYSLLAEIYLLQARLSLITLNMKKARQFLTKSQKIAEKYGLNRLAIKVSSEHDELLKQQDQWNNIKDSEISITERLKLSGLDNQMQNMVRKRAVEDLEVTDEDPVLLLIISEGGTPIFSQSFVKDQEFKDHLFGGFLSAINTFMDEMFSEGLDRASFGEHTLLMNSISPFFICYIFKGQSYVAHHRLMYFLNKLQNEKDIWYTFERYFQKNQEISLKDIPSLEPLITEVFINKEILIDM